MVAKRASVKPVCVAALPCESGQRAPWSGIDLLRKAVGAFSYCREDFLTQFCAHELIAIYDAWTRSGWDYYPDSWNPRQVREALRGIPPNWDANTNQPLYTRQIAEPPTAKR